MQYLVIGSNLGQVKKQKQKEKKKQTNHGIFTFKQFVILFLFCVY